MIYSPTYDALTKEELCYKTETQEEMAWGPRCLIMGIYVEVSKVPATLIEDHRQRKKQLKE